MLLLAELSQLVEGDVLISPELFVQPEPVTLLTDEVLARQALQNSLKERLRIP